MSGILLSAETRRESVRLGRLTIDRIIFRSKMRGWITPEEGHEKAVPFSADERSRA